VPFQDQKCLAAFAQRSRAGNVSRWTVSVLPGLFGPNRTTLVCADVERAIDGDGMIGRDHVKCRLHPSVSVFVPFEGCAVVQVEENQAVHGKIPGRSIGA